MSLGDLLLLARFRMAYQLAVVLQSIPSIPGLEIVDLVASLATATLHIYEEKCFNDTKVLMLQKALWIRCRECFRRTSRRSRPW